MNTTARRIVISAAALLGIATLGVGCAGADDEDPDSVDLTAEEESTDQAGDEAGARFEAGDVD